MISQMVKTNHFSVFLFISVSWFLPACRTGAPPCADREVTIVRGGTVFVGDDLKAVENATLVIDRGAIAGVYGPDEVPSLDPCRVEVDARGSFILPGLWDAHVHVSKMGDEVLRELPSLGITAVRDMGSSMAHIAELRRRAAMKFVQLPHIATPGPMYEGSATFAKHAAERTLEPWHESRRPIPASSEALMAELSAIRDAGADFVKLRAVDGREQFLDFVRAASEVGLPVASHPPPGVAPHELNGKGVISIEHASYPYPIVGGETPAASVVADLKASGIAIVPTLAAWRTQIVSAAELKETVERTLTDPELLRFVPPRLAVEWKFDLERRKPRNEKALQAWRSFHEQLITDLRALHEGGVPLVAGSDAGVEGVVPGVSLHQEICALVRDVGMSPLAVLRANSVTAARLSGMSDRTGSIARGKSADLIVLGRDPRDGVESLQSLQWTYLRGEPVRASALGGCR